MVKFGISAVERAVSTIRHIIFPRIQNYVDNEEPHFSYCVGFVVYTVASMKMVESLLGFCVV